jgi:CRP/FNR family transcriptional regulator
MYLYLVLEGRVKLSRYNRGGRCTIIDVCQANEFFGEAVLLPVPSSFEQATAIDDCRLMSWTRPEIEEILSSQPKVAILLIRAFAERIAGFGNRIESLCSESIQHRIATALAQLATRTGIQESGSALRMPPLTHEFLAQFIGTSREMVTLHMNRFRKGGYVSYSRRSLSLYSDALQDWLSRDNGNSAALPKKSRRPNRLKASSGAAQSSATG